MNEGCVVRVKERRWVKNVLISDRLGMMEMSGEEFSCEGDAPVV